RTLARLDPGTRIGHYELIRELGSGGMGVVFLARDIRLVRRVAIKFLRTHSPRINARFLSEAQATARCRHDNIVVIYDVGEFRGLPFMVLEYLHGHTIHQLLDGSPLSVPRALDLMVPVVRALVRAHEHGIVHRDLKPANIFVTDQGAVKVLDFGVAKILAQESEAEQLGHGSDEPLRPVLPGQASGQSDDAPAGRAAHGRDQPADGLTATQGLVGTPPYMSPEQLRGEAIDGRSDIWAVGIILYTMLLGRHPLRPLTMANLRGLANGSVTLPAAQTQLPGLGPLTAVIDRCLSAACEQRMPDARALLDAVEACQPARIALQLRGDENPFTGLAAFQESDTDRFFGRGPEITRLVAQLRHQPLLTVVGPSGAGKSSLIRAGVIPALKQQGERWHSLIVRPGRQPLDALASAVLEFVTPSWRAETTPPAVEDPGQACAAQAARLRERPGDLGDQLRAWATSQQSRLVLFVDQFEELYTLGADAETRAVLHQCLRGVADDASSPLRIIITIRSDFLDTALREMGHTGAFARSLAFLPPMDRDGLRQALTEPVRVANHDFDGAELVEDILDDLAQTAGSLPLLQFTASRLWEARERGTRRLTRASYQAMGGVAGTLAGHADTVVAGLTHDHRRLARAVLQRLVTPEQTRAIVTIAELGQLATTDNDRDGIRAVIELLAKARLLAIENSRDDGQGDSATVELIHESLITRWPTLRRWLDENREDAEFVARVRTASQQWQCGERSEDLLWRGQAAEHAQRWLARHDEQDEVAMQVSDSRVAQLGATERQYLRAVVGLAVRAKQRRLRLVVATIGLLVAVAVVVSVMALDANRKAATIAEQKTKAEQKEREARAQAVQARNASRMAAAREQQGDPTLTLALIREIESAHTLSSRWTDLARWALYQGVAQAVLSQPDVVYSAAFSPDGSRVVTASQDNTAWVHAADGVGEPLVLRGHLDRVYSAAFSPDGTRIVTASRDKTARVFSADGTGEPLVLRGHQELVYSAAFSPDGTRIVTASFDNTARVWNADGTGEPLVLRGHRAFVYSAAFNPDGTRIVTASQDNTAQVWNADGTGEPLVLRGHLDRVYSAAFSPDGARIVTASRDKTARVHSADGTGEPLVLRGHLDVVSSAAFSPDGTRIVTASQDRTARVWNADGTGRPLVLRSHQAFVYSAAFSPDGTRIVTASRDKTARVHSADSTGEPLVLRGHQDLVSSAVFSPDGTRIVTASRDKTARVYSADGTGDPLVLRGHLDRVYSAAFSPDGERIVTASWDRTARVWNADGTGEPLVLRGHQAFVYS
ncbi:MAG: protein kinase, partial [Myxococcota bacterium]